jgi:hypothetical protein
MDFDFRIIFVCERKNHTFLFLNELKLTYQEQLSM